MKIRSFLYIAAQNKRILAGLGFAVLFLVVEAAVHVVMLRDHNNILDEILAKDGHEMLLRLLIILLFVVFAVLVQISEKKLSAKDRELINAGIEWERTFEAVPDFIAIIDTQYRIRRINNAMAKRLGLDQDRVIGSFCYQLIHGTGAPPSYCPHTRLLSDHRQHTAELHDEPFGGDYALTVSPLLDRNGCLIGCTHVARDITARKRAEEALRSGNAALERQLRFTETLLKAEPIAVFFQDAEGRYLGCNEAFSKIAGVTPGNIAGKSVFDLWPPELAEVYRRQDEELLKNPGHQAHEFQVQNARGELIDVIFNKDVFQDENGNVGGIVGTFFDISDRKRAEAKIRNLNEELEQRVAKRTAELEREIAERIRAEKTLQASEERYRTLVEQASDGIYIADGNGNYVDVNASGCRMLGYPREQLLQMNIRDVVPRREQGAIPLRLDELRSGKPVLTERSLIRRDGSTVPVEINASMLSDGRLLGFVRDVTERRRAEEALIKSEEKYRTLFEESFDGLFITSPGGRILDMNKKGVSMFGYDSKEEVLSLDLAKDVYANQPDRQRILAMVNERGTAEYEIEVKKKSGERMTAYCALTAVREGDGAITSYRGIIHDITERKQAEQEHLAHLRFFESMDRVNRTIQAADDLDQMMRDALDLILELFDCDRAWLVYPCDPEADVWRVPMERTRPEYPGVLPVNVELPLDPAGAEMYRILRHEPGPVQFGPGSPHKVPNKIADGFKVQSFIATALYPRAGKPWALGLHQCSHPRVWTREEERLIREIGRRLSEALTSLTTHRNLLDSENRYRRITSAMTDYMYSVGVEHGQAKETRHGPGCRMITGYTAEEFAADPYLWITMVAPEDRKAVEDQTRRVLAGEDVPAIEHRLIRKDGRQRWVLSTIVPRRDPHGRIQSYDGLIQDVTERKQAEEMLRNYTNRLRTLSARLMEARESERRHISHELHDEIGQSLTGIKLSLDGLRRKADPSVAESLCGIQEELNHLMERVRDLSLNLRPAHLDTLGLLPTLQWHFKRYTEQTGMAVDFVHDRDVRRLPMEIETVLYRVVQEALTNAARHAEVESVRVALTVGDRDVRVAIEDEGTGFDVKDALESGRTMGLSGMRERVDDLGGSLTIRSAPGEGTQLTISLPPVCPLRTAED